LHPQTRTDAALLKPRQLKPDHDCGGTIALPVVSSRTEKEKTKMRTKMNLTSTNASMNLNETLVRDSKNLKVKAGVRAGLLKKVC
jgi:hypothetical protein